MTSVNPQELIYLIDDRGQFWFDPSSVTKDDSIVVSDHIAAAACLEES